MNLSDKFLLLSPSKEELVISAPIALKLPEFTARPHSAALLAMVVSVTT
jgi:hypothetical protein